MSVGVRVSVTELSCDPSCRIWRILFRTGCRDKEYRRPSGSPCWVLWVLLIVVVRVRSSGRVLLPQHKVGLR